jgi:uncharacterized protein (DUF924 family)
MNPDEVHRFWFGAPGDAHYLQPRALWFTKSDAIDREIGERFGLTVEAALAGQLDAWAAAPRSALALVIVLDQFTRNIFRGTARAFAGDARALAVATRLVDTGRDLSLLPIERWFAYMPFEHSERLVDQLEAVRLFERLAADGVDAPLEWARRHYDVIARFGRFPHRNAILGRASTPEEIEFLKQPGSGF